MACSCMAFDWAVTLISWMGGRSTIRFLPGSRVSWLRSPGTPERTTVLPQLLLWQGGGVVGSCLSFLLSLVSILGGLARSGIRMIVSTG